MKGDRSRPDGGLHRLVDRRTFVATGGTAAMALLAGCIAGDDGEPDGRNGAGGDGEDGSGGDGSGAQGSFRLLVSDRPAAIDDFDSLEVSFDHARIFPQGDEEDGESEESGEDGEDGESEEGREDGESGDGQDGGPGNGEGNGTDGGSGNGAGNAADEESDGGDEGEGSGEGDDRGWRILDLDGATVDLTEVVGDRATPVFEGELEAGRYAKVELHVSDVEGVVDGEGVDVKIPSEKLQIVHPFEVRAGEATSFVFDVNVVEKGNGGYNLTPVISESGVAGEDVEVEEVDGEGESGNESDGGEDGESDGGEGGGDGEGDGESGEEDDENDGEEEGDGNGEGDGEDDGENGSGDGENGS